MGKLVSTYFVNYTKTSLSKNEFMDYDVITDDKPLPMDQNIKKTRFKRHYKFSECEASNSKVEYLCVSGFKNTDDLNFRDQNQSEHLLR